MPDPQADPHAGQTLRVAKIALVVGLAITLLKLGVFFHTRSAAVLTDAAESVINLIAAAMMIYSIWLAGRPADADHPYGHGKIEFMAVGMEGWLILTAGAGIVYESVRRLINRPELDMARVQQGVWLQTGVAAACAVLAGYVYLAGRRHRNATLIADSKHLATDVLSTVGSIGGLALVHYTGQSWLDPLCALILCSVIFYTSWHLLWQSIDGLMDRADPADETAVRAILDDEVKRAAIKGYHKVRLRHNGAFHWVDLHLQVDSSLSVQQGHAIATRIEMRIEQHLGEGHANATAHIEPFEPPSGADSTEINNPPSPR